MFILFFSWLSADFQLTLLILWLYWTDIGQCMLGVCSGRNTSNCCEIEIMSILKLFFFFFFPSHRQREVVLSRCQFWKWTRLRYFKTPSGKPTKWGNLKKCKKPGNCWTPGGTSDRGHLLSRLQTVDGSLQATHAIRIHPAGQLFEFQICVLNLKQFSNISCHPAAPPLFTCSWFIFELLWSSWILSAPSPLEQEEDARRRLI